MAGTGRQGRRVGDENYPEGIRFVGTPSNRWARHFRFSRLDITDIQTVRDNSPVDLEFSPTRIRLFVDAKNVVTVEPRIG